MKNTKKMMTSAFAAMMAFGSAQMVLADTDPGAVMDVDPKNPPANELLEAPATHKVELHKLMYQNVGDGATITQKTNTGLEMQPSDFGASVKPYDKAKMGDVSFSVYKLDKNALAGKANTQEALQGIADEVETAVLAKSELPYGAVLVEEQPVNAEGVATFEALNGRNNAYVFVETKLPASVTQKAKPLFLYLPVTNAEGTDFLKDVYLYPKNEMTPVSLEISKEEHLNKDTDPKALEGATFELYKGEPGSGEKVLENLTTNGEGKFTLQDLTVGKYYLVETDAGVRAIHEKLGASLILEPRLVNAATNKLTFEYKADGTIAFPEGSILGIGSQKKDGGVTAFGMITNFEAPGVLKGITNSNDGEAPIPSFNIGDTIEYSVNIDVPFDIARYPALVRTPESGGPVIPLKFTDTPAEGITLPSAAVTVMQNGAELKADEAYFYTKKDNNGGFELVFDPAHLTPGKPITVTYQGMINAKARANTELGNNGRVDFNNGHTTGMYGPIESVKKVKTYDYTFLKKARGIFNTDILAEKLPGAEFIVKKTVEGETKYLVLVGDTGEEVLTWEAEKESATKFTTNEEGIITIHGLDLGDYLLEETKAPEGYLIPVDEEGHVVDVPFTVGDGDAGKGNLNYKEVVNQSSAPLPLTGSVEILLIGAGLAGTVFVATKLRKKESPVAE